jgi:hypothetical protein
MNWRRHPNVSLFGLVAFVLFFLASFGGGSLNILLPVVLRRDSFSFIAELLAAKAIIQAVITLVAWVLLLVALFGWRSDRNNPAKDT